MNIVIATCNPLPSFEKDDDPFHACLDEHGVVYEVIPWDEITEPERFDACLIRTTWDYVDRWKEFQTWITQISTKIPLWNSKEIIRWNIDKRYLQYLHERGVPIAPTVWLDSTIDLKNVMKEKSWERGFIKPVIGACASDTFRFTQKTIESAQRFLDVATSHQRMMLQPYLKRVETQGEYSAIYFGGRFSHAVRKVPVKGDYRVQDDYGAFDEGIVPPQELLILAQKSLECIPYPWLYARVDALVMDDGTWVLNELEMIEPSLFFRHAPHAPKMLYEALVEVMGSLFESK